jgi:DUF4097 and DUF4098 domain-containing protein YvlB
VIENLTGSVHIEGWDRDAMEVTGADARDVFSVRRSGPTVRISPDAARGRRRSAEAHLRVPVWAEIDVGGPSLDVFVRGVDGNVRIRNVSGDVQVDDVGGPVEVVSIDGEIKVTGARMGVSASSQSDDVTLVRVSGPIEVHSGSGDVWLADVDSDAIRAETQDGDIVFSGTIAAGGAYGFFVHDGDASIALPRSVSATVSVSTFDGEFASEFPIRVDRFTSGRQFEFVLGDGGARIEIEVFDGEINLLQRN